MSLDHPYVMVCLSQEPPMAIDDDSVTVAVNEQGSDVALGDATMSVTVWPDVFLEYCYEPDPYNQARGFWGWKISVVENSPDEGEFTPGWLDDLPRMIEHARQRCIERRVTAVMEDD